MAFGVQQLIISFLLLESSLPFEGVQSRGTGGVRLRSAERKRSESSSETLFLTPLIENGMLDEARDRSTVGRLGVAREVPSHAGFITVNKRYNSNIFFWFVPAEHQPKSAPVVLWMQGGPGTTSLLGFFSEHGPYRMNEDGDLVRRPHAWTERFSVLYVDQPVGTGFSFTESERGYARNMRDVGRDMLEFLEQFFMVFGHLSSNDFYITGESYAGKYVPAVAAAIHRNADKQQVHINLKGVAMGNGLTDPATMTHYGPLLLQLGLVGKNEAAHMTRMHQRAVRLLKQGRGAASFDIMDSLFFGILNEKTYFQKVTGFSFYYNLLNSVPPAGMRSYKTIVQMPHVRRAIHVGDRPFSTNRTVVMSNFKKNFMVSEKGLFKLALENYRVLVFSGMLDICVPTVGTEKFLDKLHWPGRQLWAQAERKPWVRADGEVLGYVKTARNLSFVAVRGAGHMVPFDKPEFAFDMISRFIYQLPFV
ncbi:hypothetical protein MTO96_008665 [Rhipicephalus appendiculatus]